MEAEAEVDLSLSEGLTQFLITQKENVELFQEQITNAVSFDFSKASLCITGSYSDYKTTFTKGCKWSPDGLCLLTNSNDNTLRLLNTPPGLYNTDVDPTSFAEMQVVLRCKEGSPINDFCWYPGMNSQQAETCCFITAAANNPLHMWDAYTGELRCTYRPYNHVDEVTAAWCVTFDRFGEKIFSGFRKCVRIFDTSRPGRDFFEILTNADRQGQSGIISCIACSPVDEDVFACGSYTKMVGIYSLSEGQLQFLLGGHSGGITHMKFSNDGLRLYTGGRKDTEILCWDLRNPGKVLHTLMRCVKTNQRIYFDISPCGNYLFSGNTNGLVSIWNLRSEEQTLPDIDVPVLAPCKFFLAHDDCVNGISVHPHLPVFATSSGRRHLSVLNDNEDSERVFIPDPASVENSIRIWYCHQKSTTTTEPLSS